MPRGRRLLDARQPLDVRRRRCRACGSRARRCTGDHVFGELDVAHRRAATSSACSVPATRPCDQHAPLGRRRRRRAADGWRSDSTCVTCSSVDHDVSTTSRRAPRSMSSQPSNSSAARFRVLDRRAVRSASCRVHQRSSRLMSRAYGPSSSRRAAAPIRLRASTSGVGVDVGHATRSSSSRASGSARSIALSRRRLPRPGPERTPRRWSSANSASTSHGATSSHRWIEQRQHHELGVSLQRQVVAGAVGTSTSRARPLGHLHQVGTGSPVCWPPGRRRACAR